MFFQEAPPDTSGYMIAGYAVTFLVMALYVASMYLRSRNLDQDMSTLQEMDEPAPPTPVSSPKRNSASPRISSSAKPVTKRPRKK